MKIFLTGVFTTWVETVKTHQIVHLRSVHFTAGECHQIKKKKEKKKRENKKGDGRSWVPE